MRRSRLDALNGIVKVLMLYLASDIIGGSSAITPKESFEDIPIEADESGYYTLPAVAPTYMYVDLCYKAPQHLCHTPSPILCLLWLQTVLQTLNSEDQRNRAM